MSMTGKVSTPSSPSCGEDVWRRGGGGEGRGEGEGKVCNTVTVSMLMYNCKLGLINIQHDWLHTVCI